MNEDVILHDEVVGVRHSSAASTSQIAKMWQSEWMFFQWLGAQWLTHNKGQLTRPPTFEHSGGSTGMQLRQAPEIGTLSGSNRYIQIQAAKIP